MKKILVFLLILSLLAVPFFSSCDNEEIKTPTPPAGDDIKYVIFMIDDVQKAKIPVLSDDTYESLEPYFPTVPDEYGDDAYWEIKEIDTTKNTKIKLIYGDAVTAEVTTEADTGAVAE